jgi:pyruvate dehydrogenase (quinone)
VSDDDDGPVRTLADALVERLVAWDVRRLFGYSGDGINGVMGALQRAGDDGPTLVQARHEENAALMASGHAKYTGSIGVCVATQGPGAVHLLNGLYDAKLDHVPVLALVGQQSQSVLGSAYQQELDLHALFGDVASAFLQEIRTPEQVPMLVDRAIRNAYATRQPTCLIFPHDVQDQPAADLTTIRHGLVPGAVGLHAARPVPDAEVLDAMAAVLNEGRRVALLVGRGARKAADEVAAVAERLGAGVATSLMGKPVLDESLPFVCGPMGHLGTTASWELMRGCDTLLMVGTNEPWTEFLPSPGQARGIQIDIDGRNLGVRYPTELNVVGDAGATLQALLPRLDAKADRSWRRDVERWVGQWWEQAERRALAPARPLNPQLPFWELSRRLPHDALLAVDVGSCTYWYARCIRMKPTMDAHLSSTLASMGSAMPFAVAAKSAFPDRLVVGLAGDGAMQMNGINELITISRLWRSWSDPRLPILVLDNGDLSEVSWEMREMEGSPRWDTSQDLPAFPYAAYAELLGLRGVKVDDAADVGAAWDEALAADRPMLIQAVTDPDVPLLPPHMPQAHVEQLHDAIAEEDGAEHVEAQIDVQALADDQRLV